VILEECWLLLLIFIAILLWIFPDGTLPSGRCGPVLALHLARGILWH
jgi:hypothetical protein